MSKDSISPARAQCALPQSNGKPKVRPRTKARATAPSGKPEPGSPLTPEESARKFQILEGIRAIPVKDMPSCWKPLAESWMSHAGYGQCTSYAGYETLGKETGCNERYVRDLSWKLLKAGWFLCAGRRQGQSKHCRPEIVPGPRLIAYLRSYFTQKDAQNHNLNGQPAPEVDVRYVNPVDGRYVNKPFDQPVPRTGVDQPGRVGPADARLGDARPALPALNSEGTIPLSPPSKSMDVIAELERELPGLEADVAAAINPCLKRFAQLALDQVREKLALLKNGGGRAQPAAAQTRPS